MSRLSLVLRMSLALSGATAWAAELPDIDVTCIERTPRYNPIPWIYPDVGPPFRGDPKTRKPFAPEVLKAMKERPAERDPVRFSARVINASDTPGAAFRGKWILDGAEVREVEGGALGPWEEASFDIAWLWSDGPHTIEFHADPDGRVTEACEKNNRLEIRTDALALQMRVTRELYEAFRKVPNALGSRSFEDWVQRHILITNNTFAACAYPRTCPKGIGERVRVDHFAIMTKEEMQARQPQSMGCDGGWNFYDDAFPAWFDGHVRMDLAGSIDWGLIHELTHQLGIIDLYTIVVAPHWNHVRDAEGQPLWLGYGGSQPCIMSGSGIRVTPDGSVLPPVTLRVEPDGRVTAGEGLSFQGYSEHSAGGLERLRGLRRGHFGLYLFDLPEKNLLKVLDNTGRPVADAGIAVHQQTPSPGPQSIGAEPTMSGKTDAGGIFDLGPRPFGDINTIGLNGILFFRIASRGHAEYRFLDITSFNIAKWQGQEEFTAIFRTGIPGPDPPPPVQGLRFELWDDAAGGEAILAWDPPQGVNSPRYHVHRVFAPQYHSISFQPRYEKIDSVSANRAKVKLPPGYAGITDVPCFMVTAIDSQGRESGFADDRQLTRFAFPGGGARIERSGPAGKTVRVDLGPQGSIHLRESALIDRGTSLRFRFWTRSASSSILRLSVAGLGDLAIALSGTTFEGLPVLSRVEGLNDGDWHSLDLDLRALLDRYATEKKLTPTDARTTWNDAWLITALRFGHFASGAQAPSKREVYEFEDLELTRRPAAAPEER